MNLALRIILLIWVLGYLVASCAPILNGHLFIGTLAIVGSLIFFIPWVIGIVVLVFFIWATNPPRR